MCASGAEPIPITMIRRIPRINLGLATPAPSAANTWLGAMRVAISSARMRVPRTRFTAIRILTRILDAPRAEGSDRDVAFGSIYRKTIIYISNTVKSLIAIRYAPDAAAGLGLSVGNGLGREIKWDSYARGSGGITTLRW